MDARLFLSPVSVRVYFARCLFASRLSASCVLRCTPRHACERVRAFGWLAWLQAAVVGVSPLMRSGYAVSVCVMPRVSRVRAVVVLTVLCLCSTRRCGTAGAAA